MIREVDTDDTGNLDFPKFLKVMSRTARPTVRYQCSNMPAQLYWPIVESR